MAAKRGRQITNFGGFFDPFAIGAGMPRGHGRLHLEIEGNRPSPQATTLQPGVDAEAHYPALSATGDQPGVTVGAGQPGIVAAAE